MKISLWDTACNILKGTIKYVDMSLEEPEIVLEIAPGVEITSAMPISIARQFKHEIGKEAYFTIDASDIIIAVD